MIHPVVPDGRDTLVLIYWHAKVIDSWTLGGSTRTPKQFCKDQAGRGGQYHEYRWLWVKKRHPEWSPGTWKHGLKPAVP